MRKAFVLITVLVAVGIGGGAALTLGGPLLDRLGGSVQEEEDGETGAEPTKLRSAEAREAEVVDRFPAVGTTRAVRSVELTPRAAGVVADLDIPSGTRVAAGYGLVQLDDRAERAVLRQVEARLGDARSAVERARRLAERDVTADVTLETAEATLALVEAELDAARVAVEDRVIVAPFEGTLGISDIELGQRLETTDVVASLDDLSAVEIVFTVPEMLFGSVERGQSIRATGAGGDRSFEGEVEIVGTRIDPVARFFEVRGRFPNDDGALATGMFMNVELALEERRSVTVPEVAVVNVGTQVFVFVAEDGVAREREVRVGLHVDGDVEILEGVEAGEIVLTSGLQSLRDGDSVAIADVAGDREGEPNTAELGRAGGS